MEPPGSGRHALGCMRFVRTDDLKTWGVGEDELSWNAIKNLESFTGKLPICEFGGESGGKAVAINANDGYDAARILLPGLHERLNGLLGESFLVAVPCRDLLVAFERKRELVTFMRPRIEEDANLGAYGLTDALFICGPDGIRPA